jgi:hypothetical protein
VTIQTTNMGANVARQIGSLTQFRISSPG